MTTPVISPRLRTALLGLHRALIECERRDYEKLHGRVSPGDFLKLLMGDDAFAWLAPFTRLIVRLDELDDAQDQKVEPELRAILAAIRELLSLQAERSEFHRRYAQRFDENPDVAAAHGIAVTELRQVVPRPPAS
jgi:hypothetical protein